MPIGDVVGDLQDVDSMDSLIIMPTAPQEIYVSNIFFDGACKLYFCTASHECLIATYLGSGRWSGIQMHLNNDYFLKIKNTAAVAHHIGFEGLVTK